MDYCPICYTQLEVRECAPCFDCGWDVPAEIEDMQQKKHMYATFEVYAGLRLNLCSFCMVDFGSYRPEYFGFKDNSAIGYEKFVFVKDIHSPQVELDKFCPTCFKRLKFLKFLAAVRQINAGEKE
jgi:hypothetical protein